VSNIYPLTFNTPLLCDSASAIPEQTVKQSKFVGRVFYLKKKVGSVDYISRSEADNYKRLGLHIVVNYEDAAASWCLGGYQIGLDRGNWCATQLDTIGLTNIPAVYMSVDFRPSNTTEMNAVMECLRGFQASQLGSRGRAVYGFSPTMREAKKRGLADCFWMCGDGNDLFSGGASTHQRNDLTYVNLWQQNNFFDYSMGVEVDINYALTTQYGQWDTEEIDMAAKDEIIGFITAYVGPVISDMKDLREQLTGSRDLIKNGDGTINLQKSFPGWPQLGQRADGTNMTVVDSLADGRNRIIALENKIAALEATIDGLETKR
jgi:hypothetical protein